ncbi:MAG: hypothetical protein ACTSRN_08375 [Alphaproteobacteria bacterium]
METATITFKEGHPFVWHMYKNFGPLELSIPLFETYSAVFETDHFCAGIAYQLAEKELPFWVRLLQAVEIRHTSEPITSCGISLYQEAVQTKAMQIFPFTLVSVRQERVSDVFPRDAYGPADRAVARVREQGEPSANEIVRYANWSDKGTCWTRERISRSSAVVCSPQAADICVPTP